jgi:hypothetical protein
MIEILILAMCALNIMLLTAGFIAVFILKTKTNTKENEPIKPKELSPEALRRAERLKKEVANMMSYNGEPQEEISDN